MPGRESNRRDSSRGDRNQSSRGRSGGSGSSNRSSGRPSSSRAGRDSAASGGFRGRSESSDSRRLTNPRSRSGQDGVARRDSSSRSARPSWDSRSEVDSGDNRRGSRGNGSRPSRRRDDARSERPARRDERFADGRREGDARSRRRDDDSTRGARSGSSGRAADARGARGRGEKAPVARRDARGGERNLVSEGKSTVQTDNLVALPSEVDIKVLPRQVLAELRNISPAAADFVSKHLAAALFALEAGDAVLAHQHAIAARSRAARLPAVREMCGMAAYEAELWAEALNEFRTYMRLTGDPLFLPLMADCERGLGRPQRALQLARSEQVRSLDAEARLEMRIVASGARRDLGQFDAAVAVLEVPELNSRGSSAIFTRLRYAYAEALLAAGERLKARDWFVKTALSDVEDITDASDRALELND